MSPFKHLVGSKKVLLRGEKVAFKQDVQEFGDVGLKQEENEREKTKRK